LKKAGRYPAMQYIIGFTQFARHYPDFQLREAYLLMEFAIYFGAL
jgi:hypothetical protein